VVTSFITVPVSIKRIIKQSGTMYFTLAVDVVAYRHFLGSSSAEDERENVYVRSVFLRHQFQHTFEGIRENRAPEFCRVCRRLNLHNDPISANTSEVSSF
jgi:hypothetical protein